MVTYPSAAGGGASLGVAMYFGMPDAIVMAMLLALSVRFGFPVGRTAMALGIGLLVALLLAGGLGVGVPALPYLCGAFLVAQVRHLPRDRESLRQLAVFLVVMTGLFAAFRLLR
jgi:hypothetical protein